MPAIQLSTSTTTEWHEYEAPAELTFGAAHFEVRHAPNPWGYEVQDLRPGGQTYTTGFFQFAASGTGQVGNPLVTALMLCNPYADQYAHVGYGPIPPGPADPVIQISGAINAGVSLSGFSGTNQDGVLWTNNGAAYYPTLPPGCAVPFSVNGTVRIKGKNPGHVDRIYGASLGKNGPGGQSFPMLGIAYKNLTLMPPVNVQQTFNSPDNSQWGRLTVYDCLMKGNPAINPGTGFKYFDGYGVRFHFRLPGPGCVDLRDLIADHPEEHFFYANSINEGLLDEDSYILRCSTPQGAGRTFCQLLHRFEESPYPGRNTILVEDCEMLGCAQQASSSVFTIAGFHGTAILRNNYDAPIPVIAPVQKRSIVVWESGNKSPEPKIDEGNQYTAEAGGNHGTVVVINHTSEVPDCEDSSHWGFSGCAELHIFDPHISGNKQAIEFDHASHLSTGPQYGLDGTKGWDPDLGGPPGATVYSNNPYHTPTLKRASVNGPGLTPGAIGPGYEHIYTAGDSFADWDGIVVGDDVLVRNFAGSSHPHSTGGPFDVLDPEDYWSPSPIGGGGSSVMFATMTVLKKLPAATAAGVGFSLGLLTALDPGGESMFAMSRGECTPAGTLGILLNLACTVPGQSLALGWLTEGDQAEMIATAAGVATVAATLNALAALAATTAGDSDTTATLTDGGSATMVAISRGVCAISAALNTLLVLSSTAACDSTAAGLLSDGATATMVATGAGEADMDAALSALANLSAAAAGDSDTTATLAAGPRGTMVASAAGDADTSASVSLLLNLSALAEGEGFSLGLLTSGRPPIISANAAGEAVTFATLSELINLSATAAGSCLVDGALVYGRAPAMVCQIESESEVSALPNFLADIGTATADGIATTEATLNLSTDDAEGDAELELQVDPFFELEFDATPTTELELLVTT